MQCLVIEDEVETSRYICKGLKEAGFMPMASLNADEGLHRALSHGWDVIIVDRMLAGSIDGLSLVETLRAQGKRTPVIILSAMASTDERVAGLRSGADDYLTKPFGFSELLARIEVQLRRGSAANQSSLLQVADLTLDVRTMRVSRGGKSIPLQLREFRLLEFLMRNAGQVVTRTMLLEGVWEYHFDPQTNVIDVQISRLRTKIDKDFGRTLIHTVRGVGYRMAADPVDTDA
ncbi:response regulator transcription factor [Massilia sp. R2A-15]|uniref:winged helix-turn-helix domain-containing protein n=1 Tax=Massilia sp. R2A-15 TaxID=3064278 RepID=UPI002732B0E1|nr:response regulator transcription factor [Massilia sp. R2A-15]WLI91142.1 response regulator transcription factor [Massilia sp. R2A-15]